MTSRTDRPGSRSAGPATAIVRLVMRGARCWRLCLFALVACCAATSAPAQKLAQLPTLTRLINDNVAMLSEEQETSLDARLSAYRRESGTRVVVLTIASTAPESIEQYAGRVARDWSASHANDDNVFFVVVARDNRPDVNRVRFQPGGGARSAPSEADGLRIVVEDVLPRFQVLDYNGGIVAGIERLKSLLAGEPFPEVAVAAPPPPPRKSDPSMALAAAAAALCACLLIALPILRIRSRRLVHLTGHRAVNRSFEPMIVGRFVGRRPKTDAAADEGNGFGGGFGGAGGYAGGGGDFSGGGSTGFW